MRLVVAHCYCARPDHVQAYCRGAKMRNGCIQVGILCKILTVVINYFIWDKHASLAGIGCLGVCLAAGTFYQQAPKRTPEAGSHKATVT